MLLQRVDPYCEETVPAVCTLVTYRVAYALMPSETALQKLENMVVYWFLPVVLIVLGFILCFESNFQLGMLAASAGLFLLARRWKLL